MKYNFHYSEAKTCYGCHGTGKQGDKICRVCNGTGTVPDNRG